MPGWFARHWLWREELNARPGETREHAQMRAPVDPMKLDTVQLLRNIERRGGSLRLAQLNANRRQRRYLQSCLRLAAREQLVTSAGDRWTLTQKARDTIADAKTVAAAIPAEAA